MNNLGLREEGLKNLNYQQQYNLQNKNPVLVARHFKYNVEIFLKEIVLYAPLGKTKCYALRTEFQERVAHMFTNLSGFLANIQDENAYIDYFENTLHDQFPELENEPDFFELVKTYQIYSHLRTCWKYNKNECRFSYGHFSSDKAIIVKPIEAGKDIDENIKILVSRKTLLKKLKCYNHLNPAKVSVNDPRKENHVQPVNIPEIFAELQIADDDYYKAFSITKDDDREFHLKKNPNYCLVNNYFDYGLKPWQANMNIQPVFN